MMSADYLLPGQEGKNGPHTDPDPIADFFSDGKFLWAIRENDMVDAIKVLKPYHQISS